MNSDKEKRNTITYTDEGVYLFVSVRGPWNVSIIEKYILEVRQRLDELGYKRVLVDDQQLTYPGGSSIERYKVGVIIAREWGPYIKAAVISQPENISRYTETTAINRGANFMVFSDQEEAKKWLLS